MQARKRQVSFGLSTPRGKDPEAARSRGRSRDGQKGRLSDAGFAANEQRAAAIANLIEQGLDDGQLTLATEKGAGRGL